MTTLTTRTLTQHQELVADVAHTLTLDGNPTNPSRIAERNLFNDSGTAWTSRVVVWTPLRVGQTGRKFCPSDRLVRRPIFNVIFESYSLLRPKEQDDA